MHNPFTPTPTDGRRRWRRRAPEQRTLFIRSTMRSPPPSSSSQSPRALLVVLLLQLAMVLAAAHTSLAFQACPQRPLSRRSASSINIPRSSSSSRWRSSSSPPPLQSLAAGPQSAGDSSTGGLEGLFRLIRNDGLSLAIGSLCLVALVANRLTTPELYDSQSRTDIIGVISAGGLLLNGLTLQVGNREGGGGLCASMKKEKGGKAAANRTHGRNIIHMDSIARTMHTHTHPRQDIDVREAEAVALEGEAVDEADTGSGGPSPRQAGVLRWAADTYMQVWTEPIDAWGAICLRWAMRNPSNHHHHHHSQPRQAFPSTASVLVWHKGRTLLRKGTMPPTAASSTKGQVEVLAIVQKALTLPPEADGLSQPTYIPDLQVINKNNKARVSSWVDSGNEWGGGHSPIDRIDRSKHVPLQHTSKYIDTHTQVLPGRVEFASYLPALCQAVVLQPFDDNRGLVILGGNRKRDLTPKDLAQVRVVAQKVQSCLLQQ
jgi:hypothetical protein